MQSSESKDSTNEILRQNVFDIEEAEEDQVEEVDEEEEYEDESQDSKSQTYPEKLSFAGKHPVPYDEHIEDCHMVIHEVSEPTSPDPNLAE